jgi:hypothetical protein
MKELPAGGNRVKNSPEDATAGATERKKTRKRRRILISDQKLIGTG